MTTPTTRSQDEIAARVREIQQSGDDFWGYRQSALIDLLDFGHARPFLKPDVTESEWAAEPVEKTARQYLKFAFSKTLDHRGLSAERSVDKLSSYAWVLGRSDVAEQMQQDDNYPQYGAPALVIFAEAFSWPIPDDPRLARMAQGLPCEPDCQDGCGR